MPLMLYGSAAQSCCELESRPHGPRSGLMSFLILKINF
jgi:hypothetical protein